MRTRRVRTPSASANQLIEVSVIEPSRDVHWRRVRSRPSPIPRQRALRAHGHAVADTLVVRPPVVLGVLVLAWLPAAFRTGQRLLVGYLAKASPTEGRCVRASQ